MQVYREFKSATGSIAVYVSIVILSMLLILLSLFFTTNSLRKSQLETAMKIKQSYEADNDRAAEIYSELSMEKDRKQYIQSGLILQYDAIDNTGNGHSNTTTTWKDLSGNNNDGAISGATWNSSYLEFDGIDDMVSTISNLNFNSSKEMTIEFVCENQNTGDVTIFMEFSENSNQASDGFYIDTGEFGTNDLTLAMKFQQNSITNHKMVNGLLDQSAASYTVKCDTTKTHDNYIAMYKNSVNFNVENAGEYDDNISNMTLTSNKLYIGGRQGSNFYSNMRLMAVRVYNRALTQSEIQHNYDVDKQKYNL